MDAVVVVGVPHELSLSQGLPACKRDTFRLKLPNADMIPLVGIVCAYSIMARPPSHHPHTARLESRLW